ncbi:MAG: methyltransferase domain-containing protein [Chromatiales bacterium]
MIVNSLHNEKINEGYDAKMYNPLVQELFEGTDFYNFGYWYSETKSQNEACENLIEQLLDLIPVKGGKILDVACGKGATTCFLTKYYDPRNIIGINLSDKQLESSRMNAPGCRFIKMDATRLTFNNQSFNAVVAVEAAFHFKTRETFIREAYRVLVSGGHLVLSDILFKKWAELTSPGLVAENHLETPADYRALLERIGFDEIVIQNVTTQTLRGFIRHMLRFLGNKLYTGQVNPLMYGFLSSNILRRWMPAFSSYLIACAHKPVKERKGRR